MKPAFVPIAQVTVRLIEGVVGGVMRHTAIFMPDQLIIIPDQPMIDGERFFERAGAAYPCTVVTEANTAEGKLADALEAVARALRSKLA